MDLPATQAVGEDEFPATQQVAENENNEKALVGTLTINDKTYYIASGITRIGRHPECQVVLQNETVSKNHAEIEGVSPNKTIFIRDLNSCNSTKINKTRLRPNSLYQIKNGDELTFGSVIGIFKLYQPIDDSIVSCTPQVNRKLAAIIPSTPDSSMNTSSASENDVSTIPGTQTDNTENFRHPTNPVKSSKSDDHGSPRIPAFTLNDLPSPLPKEKSRQDDICEAETQRFCPSETKEDCNDSDNIYTATTQKPSTIVKSADEDDNIYDMATQRPNDSDKETDEIQNLMTQRPDYVDSESNKVVNNKNIDDLETQPFELDKSISGKTKFLDVSIHSAATQKNVLNSSEKQSIQDLETQQFILSKIDANRNSNDVSIFSAPTQKYDLDKSGNKSIEDMETQAIDNQKFNVSDRKSNDVSIYSAPTQKYVENAETQQFDNKKLNTTNNSLHNVSIYSAATQKNIAENPSNSIENLETQPFHEHKAMFNRKSLDVSIYSAETQKFNHDNPNESTENMETQQFNINQVEKFLVPSPLRKKSNKSIHEAETQIYALKKSDTESIEDMETQQFTTEKSVNNIESLMSKEGSNKSIYEVETQKIVSTKANNKSIEDLETQQYSNKTSIEDLETQQYSNKTSFNKKTIEDLETQQYSNKTSIEDLETEQHSNKTVFNKKPVEDLETQQYSNKTSIEDLETQQYSNKTSCNKKPMEDLGKQQYSNKTSCNNKSIEDLETQQFSDKKSNEIFDESVESLNLVIESSNLSSSLSFTNQDMKLISDNVHTLVKNRSHMDSKGDKESSFDSGIYKSEQESNKNNINEGQDNFDSQIKTPSKTKGIKEHDENEEEMFSQNLIEDCPFAFVPEEDPITNDNNIDPLKSSKNNKVQETDKKTHNIIDESDSETDEEGIFTNHSSIEEKDSRSDSCSNLKIKKDTADKEADSETDEEGVFSNHLSNQSECEIKSNQKNDKNKEDDSETDEEGIFSNVVIKNKDKPLPKKDNSDDSDEDIFDNILEIEEKCNPKEIPSSKNNSLIKNSATSDSQDLILDNDREVKQIKIQKSEDSNNVEVDDFDPTQVINTNMTDIDNFLAPRQVISEENSTNKTDENFDDLDLAPTQKLIDTQLCTEMDPTQKLVDTQLCTEMAPTQKLADTQLCIESQFTTAINKQLENINDLDLAPTQKLADTQLCTEMDPTQKLADAQFCTEMAPTQKLADTQLCVQSQFTTPIESRLDNFSDKSEKLHLAPTQIIADTQPCCTESQFVIPIDKQSDNCNDAKEKLDLAPTQKIADTQPCTDSQFVTPIDKQLDNCSDAKEKPDLAPTQKIADTQLCTESQFVTPIEKQLNDQSSTETRFELATEIVAGSEHQIVTKFFDDQTTNDRNNTISRNVDSEHPEYENVHSTDSTRDLEHKELSLNQSKRQLQNLEISGNKKIKTNDEIENVKLDFYTNVEKNLDEMFDGPENEPADVDDSALLTQQLANILESSQNDDSFVSDLNESKASPTLSSGKMSKTKNRRRAVLLGKPDNLGPLVKPVINLNDTIERNLNEIFDNTVNNVEMYEPDAMMTQQLKSVLQSQDDEHMECDESVAVTKSPILCKTYEKRRHRLSLSVNLNSSLNSKKQEDQKKTRLSVQSSSSNSATESQETDEYFANLKSSKKFNVIDSQSDDEPMNIQSSIDSEREIIYKHGMVGFSTSMRLVSTKEPVALLESKCRSFTSDSQSDGDEFSSILSHKKRFSLSLSKHVDLNSSLSSLSDQEVGKKLPNKAGTPSLKKTGNTHPSTLTHHEKRVLAKGIRGFTSDELKPIESEELVSAASTESDEELQSITTSSSLSLSKHVDLSSSLSSLGGQEVEKKLPKMTAMPSLKKSGNKHPSSLIHHEKRVLARGTRGFTSGELKPIESEELVSAASTESDEELQSITASSKKVCTSKLYCKVTVNINKLSPLTISKFTSRTPTSERISDSDSDDSEFLKSMPAVKVPGTIDCPPTESQLADSSDDENSFKVASPVDVLIPSKWNLYRERRYDLLYKMNSTKSPKTASKNDEDEECARSPSLEKSKSKMLSVEDVLAEIDANQPIGRKIILDTPKQRRTRKRSYRGEKKVEGDTKSVKTPQSLCSNGSNRTPLNSPQIDSGVLKENESNSFSKAKVTEGSDSDSELNIIPKFMPLPRWNVNMNYVDSDSDSEFMDMVRMCEKTLGQKSSANPQVRSSRGERTPTAKRTNESTSPVLTQRRRPSALNTYNSLSVTHIGSDREAETLRQSGTVDQSAFVFQEAGDSSKAAEAAKTSHRRMSSLEITRTKRSVASDVDEAQKRPPKRSKTTIEDEERPKLQQLMPAPVNVTGLNKKRVNKEPKTLDNFVVAHNSKNRTDSSDLSAVESSVIEDTQTETSKKLRTRGRAAAASRKKTKEEASAVSSNNSSKENLEVENSDVENAPNTSKVRSTRLKRNQNFTNSSIKKSSSKDYISNNSVESDGITKTEGRVTRRKKNLSIKEPAVTKNVGSIIQDSDTEKSDESEFVKVKSKSRLVKIIQSSDSEKSSDSKVVDKESENEKEKSVEQTTSGKSKKSLVNIKQGTKNKRNQSVKESDLEEIDSSVENATKRTTRTRRGIKNEDSSLEKSSKSNNSASKVNDEKNKIIKETDSEKSDVDDSKINRRKRIEQSDPITIESKTITSKKNKNLKESHSEKSDAEIGTTSRSKRIKQSGTTQIKSDVKESVTNKETLDSDSEKSATLVRASRSRRVKDVQPENTSVILNQTSKSVLSESVTEKDKNLSLSSRSNSSRVTRETRKRKVSTNVSTADTPSSEDSQELAEVIRTNGELDVNTSQKRKTRRARNALSSSADSQNSESNDTQEDIVFEKPVNRPKRARIVKSSKNKSSSQNNFPSDEETTLSPQRSSMSQKRTPSPEVPSTPSRSTPSRNRRVMSMSPMKGDSYIVLFTGERSEVHRKIVAKLGGSEVEDPEKCSILVTDKVRRTYKFLCCLARGIPIVSVDWLNDSGKARRFLNWENYVLHDPTTEAKFKFSLKESLHKAVNNKLLEGYTVLITPRITQPPVTELKGMVISSGGKPLIKPPTKWPENIVIITKEEDLQNAKKFIAKAPKSVTVHSTEFILTGILRQEISFEEFQLTV